ncbi:MAG TPA: response regulator [Pyrinomonadaceae bacterium]|nr:response regulator [Pyrinomonadaceae bacterium]
MSAHAAVAPARVESPQREPALELRTVRRHALVVDDNPDITDMLAAVLRHAGYNVSTAHSAQNALEAALAKQFDVVISDIGMPGMNGYELARALRAVPEYSTTPLVAVTGFAMYDDRDRAVEAGFDAHLSKPIDPVDLTRTISGVRH